MADLPPAAPLARRSPRSDHGRPLQAHGVIARPVSASSTSACCAASPRACTSSRQRRRRWSSGAQCSRPPTRPASSPARPPVRSPGCVGCRGRRRCTTPCVTASISRRTPGCAFVRPPPSGRSTASSTRRDRRRFLGPPGVRPGSRPPAAGSRLGRRAAAPRARVSTEELAAIGRRLGHRHGRGQACSVARSSRSTARRRRVASRGRARRRPSTSRRADRAPDPRAPLVRWAHGPPRPRRPGGQWGIELDIHPEHRTLEGHAR